MKIRLLLVALLLSLIPACDRAPRGEDAAAERRREEQRLADERRIIELRDLEQRTAEREVAAREAQTEQERGKIAAERAALEREKQRLMKEQQTADAKRREEEKKAAAADAAKAAGEQARAEQKLEFFYDALDPFGDWVEVEKYGYCFQPREARDPRWRPYTDGNWAWTDYGWTWVSNEKFGWATYHYGRWARVRRLGWVWVPGSEWAAAWVAWRRSDDYVGWAPLPPEAHSGAGFTAAVDSYYDIGPTAYTFVPVQNLGERTYVGRVVEPERNVTIINKTVNVTNITYKTVENKTVVYNEGPDITVINARSAQPVQKLKVERTNDVQQAGPAERRGGVLQMAAPVIVHAVRAATAPQKVKERVKAEEVDRGWGEEKDEEETQRFRSRARDEARGSEEAQRSQKPRRSAEAQPATAAREPVAKQAPSTPKATPAEPAPTPERKPRREPPTTPAATPPPPSVTPAGAVPAAEPPSPERRPRRERPEAPAATPSPQPAPATPAAATPAAEPASPQRKPRRERPQTPVATPPPLPPPATATPEAEPPLPKGGRKQEGEAPADPPTTPAPKPDPSETVPAPAASAPSSDNPSATAPAPRRRGQSAPDAQTQPPGGPATSTDTLTEPNVTKRRDRLIAEGDPAVRERRRRTASPAPDASEVRDGSTPKANPVGETAADAAPLPPESRRRKARIVSVPETGTPAPADPTAPAEEVPSAEANPSPSATPALSAAPVTPAAPASEDATITEPGATPAPAATPRAKARKAAADVDTPQ